MKTKRHQQTAVAAESVRAMRRLIGWTRTDWINEVESWLGTTAMHFFAVRFAEKNRLQPNRQDMAELDLALSLGVIHLVAHPLRRQFDREAAFDQMRCEMGPAWVHRRARRVEARQPDAGATVRREVDDANIGMFWARIADATKLLRESGVEKTTLRRGPRSGTRRARRRLPEGRRT
jgi:hypothetical protein